MSMIAGALYAIEGTQINLFGIEFTLAGVSKITLYIIGLVGQILILTSFYLVMPLGKLSFRHALIGGVTAGLLWEVVRHVLVWYFSTLSVVSLVYGSLATAIVFLLSLEIAGLILLFGAQVIAEYERFSPESIQASSGIQS
jgi:YihY family inner membrane protein